MELRITEHCSLLKDLISLTNGMSTTQAAKILLNYPHSNVEKDLNFLQACRIITRKDDNFSCLYGTENFRREGVVSLWAFLDIISDENGVPDTEMLKTAMEGTTPFIELSFIYKAKSIINIVHFDENSMAKVKAAKQRYLDLAGEDNDVIYLFATESMKAVKMLEEMELNIPLKIALIEGNIAGNPDVTYMS